MTGFFLLRVSGSQQETFVLLSVSGDDRKSGRGLAGSCKKNRRGRHSFRNVARNLMLPLTIQCMGALKRRQQYIHIADVFLSP